jgi:hypothetical protein
MVYRIGLAICAVALLVTTTVWAQVAGISGVVTHVDPTARIVYFADGRWVRLEPETKLTVDGREIRMEALKPGTTLVLGPGTSPSQTQPPAVALPVHPPIDASGVVARVDPQTNVITFQDGRMLRVTDQTRIWQQPASIGSVRPGEQIFVHNAQPIAFQFGAVGSVPAGGRYVMGTIVRVDPASSLVALSDGTLVRIMPATILRIENRPMTIGELRPGDQVVIWQRDGTSPVALVPSTGQIVGGQSSASPSALPRETAYVTIDADEVLIVRRPQAP